MSVPSTIFDPLREAIQAGSLRISEHAVGAMRHHTLTLAEVREAATAGEVLEDYPTDFPLPGCLVLGRTPSGHLVHSVWAYNAHTKAGVLVTCYRPDPDRWIDFRVRRKK